MFLRRMPVAVTAAAVALLRVVLLRVRFLRLLPAATLMFPLIAQNVGVSSIYFVHQLILALPELYTLLGNALSYEIVGLS